MAFEPGWDRRMRLDTLPDEKTPPFRRGQIVRRVNGWTPMRVASSQLGYTCAVYCSQDASEPAFEVEPIASSSLVLITDVINECARCPNLLERLTKADIKQLTIQANAPITPTNPVAEKGHTMSKDLYQTKETPPRFGTKLTTNSEGKIVLEIKGAGGAVELFAADQIEVVMPYTVDVRFNGGDSRYSYLAKADDVAVGDLLALQDGDVISFATVIAIDTKSRNATKPLKGRKLATTVI